MPGLPTLFFNRVCTLSMLCRGFADLMALKTCLGVHIFGGAVDGSVEKFDADASYHPMIVLSNLFRRVMQYMIWGLHSWIS